MNITISPGNHKMGSIPSVSLPSGVTCRHDCECCVKCYAKRLERFRPAVKESYLRNYQMLVTHPDIYWREVEAAVMTSRFFRFHVSGDIPDEEYLRNMIAVASRNRHCDILCFTKKYDIVNKVLESAEIPENLHIVMSAWRNLPMNNPRRLPEAHIRYKDGSTTARDDAKVCCGNCTDCAMTEGGCWNLKSGEQVVLNEH